MIHKYNGKAYFSAFGIGGLQNLPTKERPPIIYMAIPNLTYVGAPEEISRIPIHQAEFRLVAMIPVYELRNIE